MRAPAVRHFLRRALCALGPALVAGALLTAAEARALRLPTPAAPVGPRVPLAYVANGGNNHVQVIDLESGETLHRLYTGAGPWRLRASPDGTRLWAQHWYAATTVVVSTSDHSVERVLPFRGPGELTPDGSRFLSFDWPGSALHVVEAAATSGAHGGHTEVTDVDRVYDFATAPGASGLYLVRYDPFEPGDGERFAYVVAYPLGSEGLPVSLPTGRSPVALVASRDPFVMTADSETNGLTLLNDLGAARSISACRGPRALALDRAERRVAVACREREGQPDGWIVTYRSDFTRRPWPAVEPDERRRVSADPVALRFGPRGRRLYVLDAAGRELLELDAADLRLRRRMAVGDAPRDVEIVLVSRQARDRLAAGQAAGSARGLVARSVARLQAEGAHFFDLAWRERSVAREDHSADEDEGHDHATPHHRSRPPAVAQVQLKPPDRLRIDSGARVHRIARGGTAISVRADGSFWPAPRQELASVVYSLPALSLEAALRALAGDAPGSPFLRSGLAVDLAFEHREDGRRYVVIGASAPGQRVAQLWIDADAGRPVLLIEKPPRFERAGHSRRPASGLVETRFLDYQRVAGAVRMPTRLQRRSEAGLVVDVELEEFRLNRGIPDARFDLARLGGVPTREPVEVPAPPSTAARGLGRAVPIQPHEIVPLPLAPHAPYNSHPPTSGPHLPGMARWGVHDVPVPPELQVHNLEVGGVSIQYNCPRDCPELVERLARITRRSGSVLLAPNPLLDARLVLSAWGRLEKLSAFEADRIERFIRAYAGAPPAAGPLDPVSLGGRLNPQPPEDLR